jgi:hypothetical protein
MFTKGISKGERGKRGPYFNLLTTITSLGNKLFFIDELGIWKISKASSFKLMNMIKINIKAKEVFIKLLIGGLFI